jgi:hypothetical protein
MTIVGICRSCGEDFSTPREVFLHRGRGPQGCKASANPIIDIHPLTGIQRESLGRVLVMEGAK